MLIQLMREHWITEYWSREVPTKVELAVLFGYQECFINSREINVWQNSLQIKKKNTSKEKKKIIKKKK